MAGPSEFLSTPEPQPRADPLSAPLEEDAGPGDLFQEINERRARIENAELLRRLRGL